MSRPIFILGLIVSIAAHGWLLWGPGFSGEEAAAAATGAVERRMTVDVVVAPPAPPKPPAPPETVAEPTIPAASPVKAPAPAPAAAAAKPQPVPKPVAPPAADPAPPAPTPALAQTHRPAPAANEGGDFSGRTDAAHRAAVRIDWGTTADAMEVLAAGGMKLVILQPDHSFATELTPVAGAWRVRPFETVAGVRYSNGLRVVDRVAAFGGAGAGLGAEQRLAVLIPVDVERQMQAAQHQAAARKGLTLAQVRTFGGRFAVAAAGVRFHVTRIQHRGS